MLCSAAPEKVSALNLKRLKADNKTCGQSQTRRDTHLCVSSFLELHFCYAKVVACGRAAERARAAACTPSPPPAARACRAASASRSLWSLRRSSDYIWSHIRKRETAVRSPVFCYRRRAAIKRSRLPMVKRRSSSVRAAAWGQVHSAG